jgi:hypothetical protein
MSPSDALERLSPEDLLWIAKKIHDYRLDLTNHPRWIRRVEIAIDNLLWSASVDASTPAKVVQDGWVRSGQGLSEFHFENVPHTEEARNAFDAGDLKAIKREHVVPRSKLLKIVLETATPEDTVRVLHAYARVVLVHKMECKRLLPVSDMPKDWDAKIKWSRLPAQLPSPWTRYDRAVPPVVPLRDGRPAATWP